MDDDGVLSSWQSLTDCRTSASSGASRNDRSRQALSTSCNDSKARETCPSEKLRKPSTSTMLGTHVLAGSHLARFVLRRNTHLRFRRQSSWLRCICNTSDRRCRLQLAEGIATEGQHLRLEQNRPGSAMVLQQVRHVASKDGAEFAKAITLTFDGFTHGRARPHVVAAARLVQQ